MTVDPHPTNPPKIVMIGNPVLAQRAAPVVNFDAGLAALIDDLFASLAVAEGVGLAAPQIGASAAAFVYDCPQDESGTRVRGHVVNPRIVIGGELVEIDEGCLSVPGPFHPLARWSKARVEGVDLHGEPIEVIGEGYFARCLQHEVDHLNGTVFVDHLPRNRRRRVLREMEPFSWNAAIESENHRR